MGLSTRILLRLALAALLLPLAVGSIYHADRHGKALADAHRELNLTAARFANAIDQRIAVHEATLAALLADGELQERLLAAAAPQAEPDAQSLLRSGRHLLAAIPEARRLELHLADGTPLLRLLRDGTTQRPEFAEAAWLGAAAGRGAAVVRWTEPGDSSVLARIAVAEPGSEVTDRTAPAPTRRIVASLVADLADLCRPALTAAIGEQGPLGLALLGQPGEPVCELTALPDLKQDALTVVADFPRHGGQLVLRQPREQVLAGLLLFERDALIAFGLVIGAIGLLVWSSLRATVLAPLRETLALVTAFEAGEALPAPDARKSRFLRRERRSRELAVLDTGLRKAILGFRESLLRTERLNATLEARVGERTLALLRQTRELRGARDEARAAVRARSDFVASVSHELRTPLNGILGLSDLLLDGRLEPAQRDCAETLRGAAETLLGIINGILDFSRLEAGGVQFEDVDLDLADLVEDTADLLAPVAHARGLALHVAIDPACPVALRGDPLRVRQVLTNLIGNALKFTTHGEVVVRVRAEVTPPRRPLSASEGDGAENAGVQAALPERVTLVFEVCDTGPGLAPDTLARLFQPFVQAEAGTARHFGGTGLGLAISRRLVEQLGGAIGASSDPGRGSTFWFRLPFAQQPTPRRAARPLDVPEEQLQELVGLRVLVVDAQSTGRDILVRQLDAWGAVVESAPTLAEGLHLARRAFERGAPIALALLDERLPDMAGRPATRELRADPALAAVPSVLVAQPDPLEPPDGDDPVGTRVRLNKPVRRRSLANACRRALQLAERVRPAARPLADAPAAPAPARGRILVAEDNAVNRKVITRQLEALGFDCEAVVDGRAAVAAWARGGHVAVLMDLNMPELDGLAATAAIRRAETPDRHIPILALTAHAEVCMHDRALEAGMDACLVKPLRREELAAALDRHVPAGSALPAAGAQDAPRAVPQSASAAPAGHPDDPFPDSHREVP